MRKILLIVSLMSVVFLIQARSRIVWSIGVPDTSARELALGPSGYERFLANDFGYEDRYFLVGKDSVDTTFPYVLPGPIDMWAGTSGTAGWRTHVVNILFTLDDIASANDTLHIHILDSSPHHSPLFKVDINSCQVFEKQIHNGGSDSSIYGNPSHAHPITLSIPIESNAFVRGGNCITLSVIQGSWILFDCVRLTTDSETRIIVPDKVFIRSVIPACYEIEQECKRVQPMLVDVEHLTGTPLLSVELDDTLLFSARLDTARYCYEVPMPAVSEPKCSRYTIRVDGKIVDKGVVHRAPRPLNTMAHYVDTRMGTAHSRWMIAPGPWMPFGMVKLSPDNQNMGWQAGYQPSIESVGCFSHIHEWTMAGLGMLPTNGPLQTVIGDEKNADSGYRSRIDKLSEKAPLGYYGVKLTDYDIDAELTATTRCGFQRYTFPSQRDSSRVLVDLHIPSEYDYMLCDVEVRQVSDTRLEGYSHQLSPSVWSDDADQEYTLYFVIEFDRPMTSMGVWIDNKRFDLSYLKASHVTDAGVWCNFDTREDSVIQVRTGISLVSIANASENLVKEISEPFAWNFEAVQAYQLQEWNRLLSRVVITTDDRFEKVRFYTNMYRALCSRNIWSDINGEWVSADEQVRRVSHADDVVMGCDAFWNTFWNLNQFWNLITPEWSNRWVRSQLAMYDINGWLAKGPAGMEYIPVMVAEHEIPLIVSTWMMGIRRYDVDKAFEAVKKMQTTLAQKVCGGFAGNRDLQCYLQYRYVPCDLGRFSNTLEYSFDDWCVSQLAEALGHTVDAAVFAERGEWWKNSINPTNGYAHMKDSKGDWVPDFDPFHSGVNYHYVEGNAWQLTCFVPHDIPGLADMIGRERFADRLQWGFQSSELWRYNAPNDQYWNFPVVQGNQQSMHFAFLFNWLKKPWLTQHWSRSIIDRYYGYGVANAYLGDEDQGQMSAWFVMAALGLFQTDGGCRIEPIYEISSPLYRKVVIDLGMRFGRGASFTIEARNVSRANKYIQRATLNGKELNTFSFLASELLRGGTLILDMGDTPNFGWGVK